ncbi:MAG: hypothetical protein AAF988_04950 [Pseudomonadota bacterium]
MINVIRITTLVTVLLLTAACKDKEPMSTLPTKDLNALKHQAYMTSVEITTQKSNAEAAKTERELNQQNHKLAVLKATQVFETETDMRRIIAEEKMHIRKINAAAELAEKAQKHAQEMADKFVPILEKGVPYIILGSLVIITLAMFMKFFNRIYDKRNAHLLKIAQIEADKELNIVKYEDANVARKVNWLGENIEKLTEKERDVALKATGFDEDKAA